MELFSKMTSSRAPLANLQIPGYLFGAVGEVTSIVGSFSDPEQQAFYTTDQKWEFFLEISLSLESRPVPKRLLYIVKFPATSLWASKQVLVAKKN